MSRSPEKKRIVIIGAGASGIAAATRLYENGIQDIIVLEAENRIGGRVHTIETDNELLEMGAQWIHGEKENVVYELASARSLTYDSAAFDDIVYTRSSGEIIEPKLTQRILEILGKLLEPRISENELRSFKNGGELYNHLLETELERSENACISDDLKAEFIEFCHQYVNSYEALDTWFNSSISTLTEYKVCEGNSTIMWNKVGYRTLFNILMGKSQELSKGNFITDVIFLKTEVEKISLQNDYSGIMIKCSNGRIIHADHVIITVSIGVLQATHTQLFESISLPQIKIDSINNLNFGTVDKIYLEFSKAWWPTESNGFGFFWAKEDREDYTKKGLGWVVDIFGVITVEFAPRVLCGWICGEAARTMESLDEQFVLQTVMQVLRKFLGKKWEIPDATRIIRSTWYTNKYFRGSYSNRSLKTETAQVSANTLSDPINDSEGRPILLFAGEATSPHYYSTVHGAVESGWREANRLIPFIKTDVGNLLEKLKLST